MEKKEKIGWLYLIAALFVAIGLFLVIKKDNYLFFALPVVLGVLLLYIFSLDKVLLGGLYTGETMAKLKKAPKTVSKTKKAVSKTQAKKKSKLLYIELSYVIITHYLLSK